ncbi:hypothetical protein V1L52_03700 [Treponema sp. HNW]|uniref:hypothetical protein n=1 Tax=Treponema sp. HNW TaxID=3116654 RepID=UPI003D13F985
MGKGELRGFMNGKINRLNSTIKGSQKSLEKSAKLLDTVPHPRAKFTASQLHSFTASQLHSFTASQLHSFTASQLHSFTAEG